MVSWYYGTIDYTRQCYCSHYVDSCGENGCAEDGPCRTPYPRNYMALHLGETETITIDGNIDEPAWNAVQWSSPFVGNYNNANNIA